MQFSFFFEKLTLRGYLIPSRFHEGYGLSEKAIENILNISPDLVITVDAGIKDVKGVGILKIKEYELS